MRYATRNNVLGRTLAGYEAGACILRVRTAQALARAQAALARHGYGLMVYDCYRPARAVKDLVAYANQTARPAAPYHPAVDGPGLLAQGYIAQRSGHSTGLAVDLTLIHLDSRKLAAGRPDCGGPWSAQEADMGTGFDCFDPQAGDRATLTPSQTQRRAMLRDAMTAAGFVPYAAEWWHYSLPPRNSAERQAMDFSVR
jgi:D-alanyl-D-alanine dipeptidase